MKIELNLWFSKFNANNLGGHINIVGVTTENIYRLLTDKQLLKDAVKRKIWTKTQAEAVETNNVLNKKHLFAYSTNGSFIEVDMPNGLAYVTYQDETYTLPFGLNTREVKNAPDVWFRNEE